MFAVHCESVEELWLQREAALQMQSFRDADPQPAIQRNIWNIPQAAESRHSLVWYLTLELSACLQPPEFQTQGNIGSGINASKQQIGIIP